MFELHITPFSHVKERASLIRFTFHVTAHERNTEYYYTYSIIIMVYIDFPRSLLRIIRVIGMSTYCPFSEHQ